MRLFDSLVIVVIALVFAVLLGVFSLMWRRRMPLFEDRQAVQQAVENHLKKTSDFDTQVAWCAAGENGFFGVFELRDQRFGLVQGRASGASVQLLQTGDLERIDQSKDGFSLCLNIRSVFRSKIKLIFDDVATATYARNLLTRALRPQ